MQKTAKLFMNNRSQAIRLPKEFRVDTDEVYLKRTREGFLVIPRDPYSLTRRSCSARDVTRMSILSMCAIDTSSSNRACH